MTTISPGDLLLPLMVRVGDVKTEARLDLERNILVCIGDNKDPRLESLKSEFCGTVKHGFVSKSPSQRVFVAGDLRNLDTKDFHGCRFIKELCVNLANNLKVDMVSIGEVPRLIGGGVYYSELFNPDEHHFSQLVQDHSFHILHESSKPGQAFRTGVYLSRVDHGQYHLLRCSTNLEGPTENFSKLDNEIIGRVQSHIDDVFTNASPLNHVLAQVYHNHKNRKARISIHSDKTKDMPDNGVIAFCTFYEDHKTDPKVKHSPYSTLRFRIKIPTENKLSNFDVRLYPGSVFVISLEMNRLYTHEIVPSLASNQIPTRLGYVIRCSKTLAQYENKSTLITNPKGVLEPLVAPTAHGIDILKKLYLLENSSPHKIIYPHFNFSLNQGDYLPPKS